MGWRTLRSSLGLALLLSALTGCLGGLGRGSYFTGQSSSGPGECVPFEFELSRDGDRVVGVATTLYTWGMVTWDVVGTLAPDNRVALETVTQDVRLTRRRIAWKGDSNIFLGNLTEDAKDPTCPVPRTVTLQRR